MKLYRIDGLLVESSKREGIEILSLRMTQRWNVVSWLVIDLPDGSLSSMCLLIMQIFIARKHAAKSRPMPVPITAYFTSEAQEKGCTHKQLCQQWKSHVYYAVIVYYCHYYSWNYFIEKHTLTWFVSRRVTITSYTPQQCVCNNISPKNFVISLVRLNSQ